MARDIFAVPGAGVNYKFFFNITELLYDRYKNHYNNLIFSVIIMIHCVHRKKNRDN